MYRLIDVSTGTIFGPWDTIAYALDAVDFNDLSDWEIWDAQGTCVQYSLG